MSPRLTPPITFAVKWETSPCTNHTHYSSKNSTCEWV